MQIDLSRYPWPTFDQDEIDAATEVLGSGKVNYWTGDMGRKFEKEFAESFGVNHAVAMANGTLTIQACLRALGVGPGDEVVTTPRTFIGTSSAVVEEGGIPVMADVDRESGNICAATIEHAITKRTKAILPVHLAGWPCEMDAIMDLAGAHNLHVIEDCAQSHGATYRGRQLGSIGHVGSWSFCQDKIMTTAGEGGMVGTDDADLKNRMWALKDHGKSFDAVYNTEHGPGFRWLHTGWGSNWRMTEVQSAIGRKQLAKLPEWTRLRTRNAGILESTLRPLSALRVPQVPGHMAHGYYKLYVYVRPDALKSGWSRDRVLGELNSVGIPGLSGSCSEIYLEKAFTESPFSLQDRLPAAKELGETSLMFLVHPTLSAEAVSKMADAVSEIVLRATR